MTFLPHWKRLACAALYLACCTGAQAQAVSAASSSVSPSSALTQERQPASGQDVRFLKQAQPLAEARLAAARLAVVKAESEPLRKLGRDIIADQTMASEELKRLAMQNGIALPAMEAERKKSLDQLERVSGAAFDREYLKLQRRDSDATLKLFEQQVKSGSGPFKSYAEAALPRLQALHKSLPDQ